MQAEVASNILVKCNDPDIHPSISRVETFPLHRDILVIFRTIHELNFCVKYKFNCGYCLCTGPKLVSRERGTDK